MASGLGYCGLDRKRQPLHGDEMRDCWAGSIGPLMAETRPVSSMTADPEHPALAFVPVDSLVAAGPRVPPAAPADVPADPPLSARRDRPVLLGWTLWGDAYL